MATESGGSTKPVAIIVLGADALLAARPATAIQLWHACLAAGYDLAVPATWGDELIAAECVRAVSAHAEAVTVMCSCPIVARAVGDGSTDLSSHLISLAAPPVATARYLRRVYGDRRVHITFVGGCPAAGDSAIDAWMTPHELLERFRTNEIELATQPQLFESVLPTDRRRHLSQPGGLPVPERLAALARPRTIVEVHEADVVASIGRHLMTSDRMLLDVAPVLGCSCSGAVTGVPPEEARLAVTLLEPPRSTRPVMADPSGLALLRRVAPRPVPRRDAPKPEAPPRPSVAADPPALQPPERPIAASRPASRSPLSWNLRERALPQPPTTGPRGDPPTRRPPASWASAGTDLPQPSTSGAAPAPAGEPGQAGLTRDAATEAAVRALHAAATGVRSGKGSIAAGTPALESGGSSPASNDEPVPGDRPGDRSEAAQQGSRATPPGGYWFVSAPAAGAPDAEVAREAPVVETPPFPAAEAELPAEPPIEVKAEPERAAEAAGVPHAEEPESDDPGTPPPEVTDPGTGEPQGDGAGELVSYGAPQPKVEPTPPDKPWVIAMTIILLLAGAMLARSVAQRRAGEAQSAGASPRRVESVSGLSLNGAARGRGNVRDADSLRSGARADSVDPIISSLFVAPAARPAAAPPALAPARR
jgi:hypothetical protein